MKEYMTSRERVHAALNFQIPDRIPLDLGGFQTGIHKKAYIELLKYLERDEEIIMLDLRPVRSNDVPKLEKGSSVLFLDVATGLLSLKSSDGVVAPMSTKTLDDDIDPVNAVAATSEIVSSGVNATEGDT